MCVADERPREGTRAGRGLTHSPSSARPPSCSIRIDLPPLSRPPHVDDGACDVLTWGCQIGVVCNRVECSRFHSHAMLVGCLIISSLETNGNKGRTVSSQREEGEEGRRAIAIGIDEAQNGSRGKMKGRVYHLSPGHEQREIIRTRRRPPSRRAGRRVDRVVHISL